MLNHPHRTARYHVEFKGKSICYVAVTEPIPGDPVENTLDLIDAADLVIYGSTNTETEFPAKVGWGHSTWEEEKLMQMANVKSLAITQITITASWKPWKLRRASAGVARDNMQVNLT